MTGRELRKYRKSSDLTQQQAAKKLGVSQTYLSLLENDKRHLTEGLRQKLVRKFHVRPTEFPAKARSYKIAKVSDGQLTADLSALGYLGFSHYKPSRLKNPADVLLSALNSDKRDARLVEALPWLVLKFHEMDWKRLVATAKLYDLQNRLGFVTNIARHLAESRGYAQTAKRLGEVESKLERSRLEHEETLCNETMTNAERRWLATNRTDDAKHWRILASLSPQLVRYVN
ncbi:MAG: helix-turn-helix transcriptional regulator [Acidobacteriota bacterium]